MERYCAQGVDAAGDRITTRLKPPSWSGARETAVEMERLFKAVTPLKEAARALLRPPLFFAAEEVFGKAG